VGIWRRSAALKHAPTAGPGRSRTRAPLSFVSVQAVSTSRSRLFGQGWPVVFGLLCHSVLLGCGDQGFFPTTVDPGSDFQIADVVFDANYFYCKVEPVQFSNSCGSGDPSKGDAVGGCHFSATAFRLTDYSLAAAGQPAMHVSDTCNGGVTPGISTIPGEAADNYQTSQARMKRDPNVAPLLQRPLGNQEHPRVVIDITTAAGAADADAIRQWATQYSTQ
jgi:hypothetical protein